jgi:type VI secretion system secreted protein VgrG
MSAQTVEVWLNLPVAEAFSVVSCQLTEGMSEITRAVVTIASVEPLDFEAAAAGPAAVTLLLDGLPVRRWTLAVWRAAFTSVEEGLLRYEVELCDRLQLLALTTSTRKFRHQSVRDIVSSVLGEQGIGCVWRTVRSLPKRSYCVQYRETGLAFVRRLLEQEGIFHTALPDGAVIFGDASGASPRVEPESRFELVEVAGALDASVLGVREIRKVARVASGSVTVNDFNWKKPGLSLLQSCAAGRDAELTIYDYPAGYREPDEGARIARTRLEAKRVEASCVEGLGNVAGFAPARVFTFGSDAGQAFAGEYLLVHVEHRVENTPPSDEQGSATTTYVNRFRAIPQAAPFRPAVSAPRPTVAGSHTAMVRGPAGAEIHTDEHGRFKAQFHWDRDASGTDADSRWIRMMQEAATSMTLARVGWEVNVAYVHGDPERPIGLSRNINGVMPPAYAQPSNKNVMTLKTPSSPAKGGYSELKLDDTAAAMRLDLRAERDLVGLVKNDKAERIGNNEAHVARASLSHEVGKEQNVTIGADSTTDCEGSYKLVVEGSRTKSVGGSETIDVGGKISVTTSGNETEQIGKVRLTIDGSFVTPSGDSLAGTAKQAATGAAQGAAQGAAMSALSGGGLSGAASAVGGSLSSMVPASSLAAAAALGIQGKITRTAANGVQRVVGGAFISAAGGDIKIDAGKGYTETVVGAKLTYADDGITQNVEGAMALTVAGALFRTAKGDMKSTAKKIKVNVGGPAALSSKEKFTISGKVITIEAATKLDIQAGAEGSKKLAIELGPAAMLMKGGPVLLESSGKIVTTGCSINLTVVEES